jgi:hypothetical protein
MASYNSFTTVQCFLDGKTVSGAHIRSSEEMPSRSVDQVGRIESVMTIVGGKVVNAADPFKKWAVGGRGFHRLI